MNNEQIVNSIKNLCKSNNITITKLEEAIGLSQGLISRWTKSEPSLSKIIDIADYFNITVDEVIGRVNETNDKFLNKLISQTSNNKIEWKAYIGNETNPKRYTEPLEMNFVSQSEINEYLSIHKTLSYYSKINDGYISIYSAYEYNNVEKPSDLKLFIQPDDTTDLVEQNYTFEQLLSLWLKVIYCLDDDSPDEIKAEDLKNSFVSECEKDGISNLQKQHKANIFISDPKLKELLKII